MHATRVYVCYDLSFASFFLLRNDYLISSEWAIIFISFLFLLFFYYYFFLISPVAKVYRKEYIDLKDAKMYVVWLCSFIQEILVSHLNTPFPPPPPHRSQ